MLAYKYWQAQVAQTAALNNADASTADGRAGDEGRRRLGMPAEREALASAVEECTDLRLPWLNGERGSCFIQGQKESTKGGVAPPHRRGGATATPANQHPAEQGD
ncbi:hypothetical protein EYF80_005530 [Liparis tanakae]|uniref:Uncharacterized protein n=1 Tax=Liparis tanakae TaxID=230148 RepID=A0A4Z2J3Y2_9TELE|nr:hypothetical protein EYF80_005530 [Liparis tanakae]